MERRYGTRQHKAQSWRAELEGGAGAEQEAEAEMAADEAEEELAADEGSEETPNAAGGAEAGMVIGCCAEDAALS